MEAQKKLRWAVEAPGTRPIRTREWSPACRVLRYVVVVTLLSPLSFHSVNDLEGYLYTVCELANQVVKHRLPALPSEAEFITCASTMSNTPSSIDMFAGEILLPKPNSTFSTPYLYVSNRNDPSPEGDTIAIFSIVNPSRLELVNEVRTGLNHVRGMEFGGVNDKWLVVGGLNAGGVKVFERVDDGKGLKAIALNEDVAAPAGFLWT